MDVLITGGAGFIGTRLMERLSAEHVVVVDSLHPQVHGPDAKDPDLRDGWEFVRGNVTDPDVWDELFARFSPQVVIHLAAETGTGQSLLQASRHTDVNVNGTAVLLDALARAGIVPRSLILTSSRAVYGEGAWKDARTGEMFYAEPRLPANLESRVWDPTDRSGHSGTPLPHNAAFVVPRPSNVYAATKLAQEHILRSWCSAFGSNLSILRLQNVYGAGQALGNPYTGVLTFFATRALGGEPIELFEGGGIVRDFVHVSDVVEALVAAVNKEPEGGYRVVDIGSGEPGTLQNFAETLATEAGSSGTVVTDKFRPGDVRAAFADNSLARDDFGYEPRVSFAHGVRELLSWARGQSDRSA